MRIDSIQITNFKGLRSVSLPASNFVCVIGENNAGKSSVMQAIMRHLDGKKLDKSHYYDPDEPVEIRFAFSGIDEKDLARVGDAHRAKMAGVVKGGSLTTIRRFATNGESERRSWVASRARKDIARPPSRHC